MKQIALPLNDVSGLAPPYIVIGNGNAPAITALQHTTDWPFHTAILTGPRRSGKSLLARWFADSGLGDALDDADQMEEVHVFHAWNRAQASGQALLLISSLGDGGWRPRLPDLGSRLGAALQLDIKAPDEDMIVDLMAVHAQMRGMVLDSSAIAYLAARMERSYAGVEKLIMTIDRLSLEQKRPPTLSVLRSALDELSTEEQPRLL